MPLQEFTQLLHVKMSNHSSLKRKIKLLFLAQNLGGGGAERIMLELAKRLLPSKYEIYICTMFPGGDLIDYALKLNVPIFCLNLRERSLNIGSLLKLYRFIRRKRIDILYSWLFYANILGRIVGRLAGVKAIISSQRNIDPWRKFYHVLIDRLTACLTDLIISNCEAGKARLVNVERISPEKIVVIYNGIDLNEFDLKSTSRANKAQYGFPNDAKVIGTVASLTHKKGHIYLLEAMSKLVPIMPNAVLVLIGDGNLKGELVEKCHKLGISANVKILGYQHRESVKQLLSIMDLFVLPSLWEGMPNAILEAQALEVPVLATNVGGVPEIIEDNRTGLLVKAGDADELFNGMLKLLSDKEMASKLAKLGYQRIVELFSIEKMVQETDKICEYLFLKRHGKCQCHGEVS